jgi:hypothetical protein
MKRTLVAIAIMISLALVAVGCGREASVPEDQVRTTEFGLAKPSVGFDRPERGPAGPAGARGAAAAAAPAAKPALDSQESRSASTGETKGPSSLDIAQRQVISTASVALEVENVQDRLNQVRAIAESLGGFIEHLSSSGSVDRQHATVSFRVPQPHFFTAMERITALGRVLSQSVGSEDVTERFIDLRARLQSALRQEQSLLLLLPKATSVSDVLTIERELSRIRSEIERLQGQLNFLERRVDLATISISLSQPPEEVGEPPSGSLTLEVSDVVETVELVKASVASLKGVVDRVFVSDLDGVQRAEVAVRVFSADFGRAIATMEGQGKVRFKETREGKTPPPGAKGPTKPNAQVNLTLVEPTASKTGLIVAIAAPVGGVILAALLVLGFLLARRRRRRRIPV